ncbi:MAG: methyltransferase domain-containing protein [Flavobacteriales bacterium]
MNIKKYIPNSIKRSVLLATHRGSRYLCPFCGFRSKDFALTGKDYPVLIEKQVIGAGIRRGACYQCSSSDRERLIYAYLKHKLNIFEKPERVSILHLAPELRLTKVLLRSGFGKYICGDLFTEGYIRPEHAQNMNVLDIPYPDNSFDLVICNHLLEHVPNDLDAMKELLRVLKVGGEAILQVPISKNSAKTIEDWSVITPEGRASAFGQFDHVRIYGQDYTERLTSAGFLVERMNISKEYPSYGLAEEEDIFIGRKE